MLIMKRLFLIIALCVVAIAEGSAQEHIDKLFEGDIIKGTTSYRMAVKRDPDSGEIIKRVRELSIIDNRTMAKTFIEAFEAERDGADAWEDNNFSNVRQIMVVWREPKRVYSLSVTGNTVVVYTQTNYCSEE